MQTKSGHPLCLVEVFCPGGGFGSFKGRVVSELINLCTHSIINGRRSRYADLLTLPTPDGLRKRMRISRFPSRPRSGSDHMWVFVGFRSGVKVLQGRWFLLFVHLFWRCGGRDRSQLSYFTSVKSLGSINLLALKMFTWAGQKRLTGQHGPGVNQHKWRDRFSCVNVKAAPE